MSIARSVNAPLAFASLVRLPAESASFARWSSVRFFAVMDTNACAAEVMDQRRECSSMEWDVGETTNPLAA